MILRLFLAAAAACLAPLPAFAQQEASAGADHHCPAGNRCPTSPRR